MEIMERLTIALPCAVLLIKLCVQKNNISIFISCVEKVITVTYNRRQMMKHLIMAEAKANQI